ncbi:hypothetical protein K2173_015319 [Erythroxylum novogranatense]|uniref:Pentatricopeptide repeat-containing protein n=1 Tax=Erythroxylum novogranatense TaxID=1862640 RepID=A0AAV8T1V6_9ROSI|nr:hypothetical protein K2173_015319 [Erythroxylum novogranatense]
MVNMLTACVQPGALELGEWIKTYMYKNKVKIDACVGNALIDTHFKYGNVQKAQVIYGNLPNRDRCTWTTMIVGLVVNGYGIEALDMFSLLLKASIIPDEVTYIGVLFACTHTGMVDKGGKLFASITTRYGIRPNVAYYRCMVDLLGRAGHLIEALELIKMPIKPNSIVRGALLGACRIHEDPKLAEMATEQTL